MKAILCFVAVLLCASTCVVAQCPNITLQDTSCSATTNCDPPYSDGVSSPSFSSTSDVICTVAAKFGCKGAPCWCVVCVVVMAEDGTIACFVHTGCNDVCTWSVQCTLHRGVNYKLMVCKRAACDNHDCSTCTLGCTAAGSISS